MSQLIQPGSYDVRELNSAMNKWEEKVRLYEKRSGTKLPEDMKSAILTEMTKGSLKEHIILNAAKLKDYDSVREEIRCYLEGKWNSEPSPMDIGAFGKGKGKGSQNTVDVNTCKKCGKKGHWAKDCWSTNSN